MSNIQTSTFLTFVGEQCGKAEEAINLYVSLFPDSEINEVHRYAAGEPGGTPELIKYGVFTLCGKAYRVSESNFNHAWSFSPGVSIFVETDSERDIQRFFEKLSGDGGQVMVPLDKYEEGDYGFGKKYGWCADKYGVNWQFILTE